MVLASTNPPAGLLFSDYILRNYGFLEEFVDFSRSAALRTCRYQPYNLLGFGLCEFLGVIKMDVALDRCGEPGIRSHFDGKDL